jgi:signal transduction histidine kinase
MKVAADFPASDLAEPTRGTSWGWFLAVAAVLTGWTVAILLIPQLSFQINASDARLPLEATATTVISLVCALAYIQYSLTNETSAFLTALAFLALASNQLVFGVLLGAGSLGITAQQETYFWTVGGLFFGIIVVIAAVGGPRWGETRRPSIRFLGGALVVLWSQATIEGTLWLLRGHLPALSSVTDDIAGATAHGALPGLTATDLGMGVSGAALFLAATLLYEQRARWDPWAFPWLPTALLLAAFSHLHYMFFPTVFTNRIATGDLLRLAFMLVLAAGLLWEIRRVYHAERQRTLELAAAYEVERRRVIELERSDRARNELFSILTHELLHPVAAIRAFALALIRRWDATEEDKRLSIVERLEGESRRLRELAEEVTSVTNLDGDGFLLVERPERVMELARQAADGVDELGGRLEVRLDEALDQVMVNADRGRILQVFRNLLSNADKYSEKGTPIELAVRLQDGSVVFTVTNEGPGVAGEDIPRLFQRFSRTRPLGKESVPGSGLGLYIAKRIVESHGGRIWLDSRLNEETTCSFTLPVLVEVTQ